MRLPSPLRTRRKAVWGPKRKPALLTAVVLSLGLASSALAHGRHYRVEKAEPGTPGSHVTSSKLDDEVTERLKHGNPLQTGSVIVTLVPGAQLPQPDPSLPYNPSQSTTTTS